MKKLQLIPALLVLLYAGVCKATVAGKYDITVHQNQQDSLGVYVGKYQSIRPKGTFYVEVALVDGQLVATATWDGSKLLFKHISGDAFIVSGLDWSIKFIRDKDNNITQMLVRGTDYWTRLKS